MSVDNYFEQVQSSLAEAQAQTRRPYVPKEGSRNETFTSLRQNKIPEGTYDFRILPAVEGKNPGMYLVHRHGILQKAVQRSGSKGSFWACNYDYVLGSTTNPEMTALTPIINYWKEFEVRHQADFKLFPEYVKMGLKELRGSTYFDVPCLFKAEQECITYEVDGNPRNSWQITKPSKNNVVGKIFQMASRSIYGEPGPPDEDGIRRWSGVLGLFEDGRNEATNETIDSLGDRGAWIQLIVQRKTASGFPEYSVKSTQRGIGPLSQDLIDKFMSEENYPDVYAHNKWMRKSNAEIIAIFRESFLYKELNRLTGWTL